MTNTDIINKFYSSFAARDAEGMVGCYADNITFEDPAFGPLHGDDAKNMWRMLLKSADVHVEWNNIQANGNTGSANWIATYTFSKTGRRVVNHVSASFVLENGKIVRHTDVFNIWKWSRQALGLPGMLLGWSPFLKNSIRKQALERLEKFSEK